MRRWPGFCLLFCLLDRPQHQRAIERLTEGLAAALQVKGDRLLWQLIRLVHQSKLAVLDTAEPLIFYDSDEMTILDQAGGGLVVGTSYPQDLGLICQGV